MHKRLGGFSLALLVVAGQIKGHPALQWVPVDVTLLAGGLVILMMIVSRLQDGKATRWMPLPVLLWVAMTLTLTMIYPSDYGFSKVQTFYTITLLLAVAPFYLVRSQTQRRWFLGTMVVVGIFSIIDVLSSAPQVELYGRVSAAGTDTIGTARLVMTAAIILAVFAVTTRRRIIVRLAAIGAAGTLGVVALMTGSRGPAVAAAAALIAAVVITPHFKKYRVRALVALLALGGIAVLVVLQRDSVGFERILGFFTGDSDRSLNTRNRLWDIAAESSLVTPFGKGWGSFEEVGGINPYPHNLLLEVAYEHGWFPVLAVALVLLAGVIAAARRATNGYGVALFALLVFSIFNAMVSSDINGSRLLVVTLFAAWAVIAPQKPAADEGSRRERAARSGSLRTIPTR